MTLVELIPGSGRRGRRAVLVAGILLLLSPAVAICLVTLSVAAMFGAGRGLVSGLQPAISTAAGLNTAAIPAQWRAQEVPWILRAGRLCHAITPADLAAQLDAESGFNPGAVSPAGAVGPAQFLPGTFSAWSKPAAVPGPDLPTVPADAIMAQGRFMCSLSADAASSGIPGSAFALALAGYNAGWGAVASAHGIPQNGQTPAYVAEVTALVPKFTGSGTLPDQIPGSGGSPLGARWAIVRAWLLKQLGKPYVWGGGLGLGPSGAAAAPPGQVGEPGYDCSGLVMVAYAHVGISLPHLAAGQYQDTLRSAVPYRRAAPGDLLFFAGSDGTVAVPGHVAIYMGHGIMLQAPETGQDVDEVPVPVGLLVGGVATVP